MPTLRTSGPGLQCLKESARPTIQPPCFVVGIQKFGFKHLIRRGEMLVEVRAEQACRYSVSGDLLFRLQAEGSSRCDLHTNRFVKLRLVDLALLRELFKQKKGQP